MKFDKNKTITYCKKQFKKIIKKNKYSKIIDK